MARSSEGRAGFERLESDGAGRAGNEPCSISHNDVGVATARSAYSFLPRLDDVAMASDDGS